jgi:ABC-type nitrate/sulfonate/bicarbonate transport system permease component
MHRYYGLIILFFIWIGLSGLGFFDSFLFPDPNLVAQAFWDVLLSGVLIHETTTTIVRLFVVCIISVLIGVPIGIVLGSNRRIYQSTELLLDMARSIPPLAVFPLFMLIFGIGDASKIAVAVFGASVIIIFNTSYGVFSASVLRIQAIKLMGASRFQIYRYVLSWECLPQMLVGFRVALSLALMIIVVTEMFVGTTVGLGRLISDSQSVYDLPLMYVAILWTGIVGYLLNGGVRLLEKRVLYWRK